MASLETRSLAGSCHCGNVQLSIKIPADSLPLKVSLCHCSSCRYTYGTPISNLATLPTGIEPHFFGPSTEKCLSSYAPASFDATRYFCNKCGCQVGEKYQDGTWRLSSVIFNAREQECFTISRQCFANSTFDGGLSTFLPKLEYMDAASNDMLEPSTHSGENHQAHESDRADLLAKCHCGGVSFTISRPHGEFLSTLEGQKWVSAMDQGKWLASLDLCCDCRLVNGALVVGWIFVPKDHISPALPADLLLGCSKRYQSSEGVVRTFCGKCGATVFYWCDNRPNIVDVATGILRAPEGVRADSWVVWRTGRIGSLQDGLEHSVSFTEMLKLGLEKWGRAQYGVNLDFVIPG